MSPYNRALDDDLPDPMIDLYRSSGPLWLGVLVIAVALFGGTALMLLLDG